MATLVGVQKLSDWRCLSIGVRRGKWRPVLLIRIYPAVKRPGLGVWRRRYDDWPWLTIGLLLAEVNLTVTGPWGDR